MLIDSLQKIFDRSYNVFAFAANIFKPNLSLKKAKWVGHRGLYNHPLYKENTLAAFEICNQLEVGIELDIHLSKDDQIIVHHDTNTQRVFSKNLDIQTSTYNEIQIKAPLIPLLSDVLNSCTNTPHFFIELKPQLDYKRNKLLVSKTIDLITKLELKQKVTLISLDHTIIDIINTKSQTIQNAIVYIIKNKKAISTSIKNPNTGLLGWHFNFPFKNKKIMTKLIGVGSINYKASALYISNENSNCYCFSNRIDYLFGMNK